MSEKTFKIVNGDMSDGYHTFDELYEHRCLLFIAWMVSGPSTDTYWIREHYDGWDLIVTDVNGTQISYHVPVKYREYYEEFLKEKDLINHTFDGHTPADVVSRLKAYLETV